MIFYPHLSFRHLLTDSLTVALCKDLTLFVLKFNNYQQHSLFSKIYFWIKMFMLGVGVRGFSRFV